MSSSPTPAPAAPPALIHVTIDGKACAFPRGTLIVDAVHQVGHPIPYYCYHSKLEPVGACRVCLVQLETPRGLMITTACTTPVSEGLKIETMAAAAKQARADVLGFLLANHPLDCPICDKGGECDLQDFTLAYGPAVSHFAEQKILRRKADDLGPFLVLDQERCIMCQRCVRYEREVLQEQNLVLKARGDRTVIETARRGQSYAGYFSGNNTELCPVGALTSRTYRFKARPWDVKPVASICQGCSVGCNTTVHLRGDQIVRLVWRDNPQVDGGWLCDRGRYGFGHTTTGARLTQPLVRRGDQLEPATWTEALDAVAVGFRQGAAVLGGARLTDEEALALSEFARTVLKTNDLDWRVGQQQVALPASLGCAEAAITDLDTADLIVLVDTNLEDEAPVLDLRLRRRAERGATILDAGPVRNFRWGPETRVPCAPDALAGAVAGQRAVVAAAKAPVVVWNGRGGAALAAAVAGLGARLLIPGEFNNGRGAVMAGLEPDRLPGDRSLAEASAVEQVWGVKVPTRGGRDTARILEDAARGAIAGLYLVGANPLRTFADGALAAAALEKAAFVVVQDLFLTETTAWADVVLPALGPLEKAGHVTNLTGKGQPVAAVVAGPTGAKADGEILRLLAVAMGGSLSGKAIPGVAVPGHGPTGSGAGEAGAGATLGADEAVGRSQGPGDPGSAGAPRFRVVLRTRLYAGGGTARFDPNFDAVREDALVWLNPADVRALGYAEGEWVHLRGAGMTLRAVLRMDPGVLPGTAALVAHTLANRLGRAVTLSTAAAAAATGGKAG